MFGQPQPDSPPPMPYLPKTCKVFSSVRGLPSTCFLHLWSSPKHRQLHQGNPASVGGQLFSGGSLGPLTPSNPDNCAWCWTQWFSDLSLVAYSQNLKKTQGAANRWHIVNSASSDNNNTYDHNTKTAAPKNWLFLSRVYIIVAFNPKISASIAGPSDKQKCIRSSGSADQNKIYKLLWAHWWTETISQKPAKLPWRHS